MKRITEHDLHLPLPDDLYRQLQVEAQQSKQSITTLARRAIEAWLKRRQKVSLHKAVASYAAECAGSDADLVEG